MKKISAIILKRYLLPLAALVLSLSATKINLADKKMNAPGIEGRWDITIHLEGKELPSWLEVTHSGNNTWVGQFVGIVGSARPISRIIFEGDKLSFSIPPQWEEGKDDLKVEGKLDEDKLSGTMITPEGKTQSWTAVRAPLLREEKQPVWGNPVKLFNGKNLDGWEAIGTNQWVAEGGILKSSKSGANIYTTKTFKNFKLHIEFRIPKGSNSGVYLRGRYEVQISDSKGMDPSKGEMGAIYGFITPSEMAAKSAGEWQYYDITLVGRMLSVVANGKTIICNQEIPGITGGALDSNENEPGPIMIQGDHGAVEYRNILITLPK